MNIETLILDYKKQTKICAELDESDGHSVKRNNKAVDRMYEIVDLISQSNNLNDIAEFSKLLKDVENRTNLWSAVHVLEKLSIDENTEKEALNIIEKVAEGHTGEAMGFRHWLKDYKSK